MWEANKLKGWVLLYYNFLSCIHLPLHFHFLICKISPQSFTDCNDEILSSVWWSICKAWWPNPDIQRPKGSNTRSNKGFSISFLRVYNLISVLPLDNIFSSPNTSCYGIILKPFKFILFIYVLFLRVEYESKTKSTFYAFISFILSILMHCVISIK